MSSTIDFTQIGNYRVISYDTPFSKVQSINGIVVDTENEVPNYSFLFFEFRWSLNGDNWSLWIEATSENFGAVVLDKKNPFYLEFRVTSKSDDNFSPHLEIGQSINPPIILVEIAPDLSFFYEDPRNLAEKPKILCSDQKYDKPVIFNPNCGPNTFDPYAVNRGINIAQDLSQTVNVLFGHLVNYYSVQPNGRGRDVILREYNLFDVVDEKCLKVLVDKNNFGDGKPIYDSFGVQFDPNFLEVHIDKKYFESFFGKGSQPRKRDIIYFPLTNRIYTIDSTYVHRDFNYAPIFFKCQLVKYEKRQDTIWKDPAKEKELHDYTVSAETLFAGETQEQIEKITKPQQYYVSTQRRNEDPVRSYISKNLPIIEFDLNNNWLVVFNSYYDMETLGYDGELEAVRYNNSPFLGPNDEISFNCWFKTRNFIDRTKLSPRPPKKLPISSFTQSTGTVTYSTFPVKHGFASGSPFPDSYAGVLGTGTKTGVFKLIAVPDDYTFTVYDDGEPITDITNWKAQKSENRVFLEGTKNDRGIRIEMIWTGSNSETNPNDYLQVGSFRILLNGGFEILSPFGSGIISQNSNFIPTLDDWYGFVFNLSNIYNQYSINVWGLSYDPSNTTSQSSNLNLLHTEEQFTGVKIVFDLPEDKETNYDNPTWGTNNNSYKILSSPLYITNLRLFNHMIAQEKQSAVLNQNIVTDSQMAIIIDNAKPVLKLPRFVKNR